MKSKQMASGACDDGNTVCQGFVGWNFLPTVWKPNFKLGGKQYNGDTMGIACCVGTLTVIQPIKTDKPALQNAAWTNVVEIKSR